MDAGHDDVRRIALLAHHGPLVSVGLPPVGVDGRSRLDGALDERDQAVLQDVIDTLQADPPKASEPATFGYERKSASMVRGAPCCVVPSW
jgi:hypothetical protein